MFHGTGRQKGDNMAKKEEKTNVMRLLDQKKIPYTPHAYPHGADAPDGVTVARSLGLDPAQVFKTLVTKGASGGCYVFDIPVAATLDLKKAAKAVGEKSVAMLPSRELLFHSHRCSTRAAWSRTPSMSPPAGSDSRWSWLRRT